MNKDKVVSKLKRNVLIGFAGLNLLGAGKISARENNGDVVLSSTGYNMIVFQQKISSEDTSNRTHVSRSSYNYSPQQGDGEKGDERQRVSETHFSNREDLGDGYVFISASSKYKENGTEKRSKLACMITPEGKFLDCSFIDNNQFAAPSSVKLNEDGSISRKFDNNLDERRMAVENAKTFNAFMKQAAEKGFNYDEMNHLAVHLKRVKDRSEGKDVGQKMPDATVKTSSTITRRSFSQLQGR